MPTSDQDVIDYLIQHAEGLQEYLKPLAREFLAREAIFSDIPELFQEGYEEFVIRQLYDYLTDSLNVEYHQLENFLNFPVLVRLWRLDPKGRKVSDGQ